MVRGLNMSVGVMLAIASVAVAAEPRKPLSAVPIQRVTVDDPFWSPKASVWRDVTIGDCFDKFDRDGTIANFDHVRDGELSAKHGGPPWYDGLLYETIQGAADFLAAHGDAALEARLDDYVDRIAAAAARDPDGYINTWTQMNAPDHRWGQHGGNDREQHDVYNAGCLVDAGVHYYRATGKTKLLRAAVRLANYMCRVMGPAPKQNIIPGHAVSEQALVGLARLVRAEPGLRERLGEPVDADAYVALARFWLDARGHHEGRQDFEAYDQDHEPVLEQQTIEGHAVRAALMCDGLTAVASATGDDAHAEAAQRLWSNMVGRRMYVTGGIGSVANEEKFGPDFSLPNSGYAETCAAVANGFFSHDLNLASGDAATADEVERTLYNGALAGVSLSGNRYFYENPLEAGKGRLRWPWHACPCCPPMFLKLMGAMPGYVYATDGDGGLYVNLFVGSTAQVTDGLKVTQATRYPRDGDVHLMLEPAQPKAFAVYVRVPGWCRGGPSVGGLYTSAAGGPEAFRLRVNGQAVPAMDVVRGYARIEREWKSGDVVDIHMDMPVRRVSADPRVTADRGRVALMRGPLVYCLESVDNGGRVRDLFIPDDATLTTELRPDLLGGVTLIHAAGQRVQGGAAVPVEVTAIPYYANANRGPDSMTVWVPTSTAGTVASSLASSATATASHCYSADTVTAMNDETSTPRSSSDEGRPRFTWWDHRGTAEWAEYAFPQAQRVSSVDVYWWDETATHHECRVPASWRLLYRTGDGTWQPVPGQPELGTRADTFNTVQFDPVTTTGLRIEAQLQPEWSGGILQWRVHQ